MHRFAWPQAELVVSFILHLTNTLYCQSFQNMCTVLVWVYKYYIAVLICISLVTNEIEHLFLCWWPFGYFPLVCIQYFCNISLGYLPFFWLICKNSLCILNLRFFIGTWIANIFSHIVACLLVFLVKAFNGKKFLILI